VTGYANRSPTEARAPDANTHVARLMRCGGVEVRIQVLLFTRFPSVTAQKQRSDRTEARKRLRLEREEVVHQQLLAASNDRPDRQPFELPISGSDTVKYEALARRREPHAQR